MSASVEICLVIVHMKAEAELLGSHRTCQQRRLPINYRQIGQAPRPSAYELNFKENEARTAYIAN